MPKTAARTGAGEPTRERILAAAVERFGHHSYEATGLRDIAADAGVDVAYVHRCFGSKERLFAAAMRTVMEEADFAADGLPALARLFAAAVLEERPEGRTRPMDIIARSFSSPDAASTIRELLAEDYVEPLRARRPEISERDATLAAAILCGVIVMRDVVAAPALARADREETRDLLAEIVTRVLSGPGPHRTPERYSIGPKIGIDFRKA